MAFEELPGLLHYDGELFVCPCGNSEMKVEIDTKPLRFWCVCGDYYTEASVADQRNRLRREALRPPLKEKPIRLKLPTGAYFTCVCGRDEFRVAEGDDAFLQLFCRCGMAYTRDSDAPALEVEDAY